MTLSKADIVATKWSREQRQAWLRSMPPEQAEALQHEWRFFGRPEQFAPDGDWVVWLLLSGRGFGKSRSITEWCRERVYAGARYIAIVARTAGDVRNVLVEGPSGLLSIFPPHQRPEYEPSKRRITFHTGAIGWTYSADEPAQLRGPEHDTAIVDELAAWPNWETFSNLKLGLRSVKSGLRPQVAVATTPKSKPQLRALATNASTVMTQGSTFDNILHLSKSFIDEVRAQYEGTALGEQELYARLLDETPGALWRRVWIDDHRTTLLGDGRWQIGDRVMSREDLTTVIVGVDPSATSDGSGAECGIIVVGKDEIGHGFVLADRTVRGSPDRWGSAAVAAYHEWQADRIVAEGNNGGAMVSTVLHTVDSDVPVEIVHASRGKRTRAEPVSARYQQGRIHHVGSFLDLEGQLLTWVPGEESPDRLDALCWACSKLVLNASPAALY